MDRTRRLRRVGILCCHFVRNYAYYKAGSDIDRPKNDDQFWVSLHGNFLDIAVLEWCKLFADHNDKHHWKKVMGSDTGFKDRMLDQLSLNQSDLNRIIGSFKAYRDKFVAHLDSKEIMNIPKLEEGLPLVYYYYRQVKEICEIFSDWPECIDEFYAKHYMLGQSEYAAR